MHAHAAIDAFKKDQSLTEAFHSLNDGRWDHMLDQTHINWFDWLEADRDTLPPVSFVNPHQPVLMGIPVPELHIPYAFSTRVTVENSVGAWPGRNYGQCNVTMKCHDPILFTMDPYGAKERWVDISAGGPRNFDFSVEHSHKWIKISENEGKIRRDGSADKRVHISVDWKAAGDEVRGDVGHLTIRATDGANVTVSVPIFVPAKVDDSFKGHVQGDGYVVIEAAHYSAKNTIDDYSWEEIDGYGRSLSGMEMFPTTAKNFTVGTGPCLSYDFWTHQPGAATITLQIGPTLNFVSGKQISFGMQVDEEDVKEIQPVTMKRLGGVEVIPGQEIFVGAVPPDWENVVKSDVRNVTVPVEFEHAGKHTLKIYGMTAGVVLERVWVDFGGIRERGYSYLGPPESIRV